jgi:transcriptional antiterminator Rof (Rho-off)/uncharacterized damage-inducible protein DinB
MKNTDTQLRYPIGQNVYPDPITQNHIEKWSESIASLPSRLYELCKNLNTKSFNNKYRKGSWNITQLLFHLTDSHTHSYIRFKWTLTENKPVIKPYLEKEWADLQDAINVDPFETIEELRIIHRRIVRVIKILSEDDLQKTFIHPEANEEISLKQLISTYSWHGNHHLAHINLAINNPVIDYIPIDCNFYDELVLLAMRKTPIKIKLNNFIEDTLVSINDIVTTKKEEFLMLSDGRKIRLDDIQGLNGSELIIKR